MAPARMDSARALCAPSVRAPSVLNVRAPSVRAAIALLLAIALPLCALPAAAAVTAVADAALAPVTEAPDAGPALELPSDLVLRAGERFEIRWSALGPAVDELEILLSIDGGRRFALRVSPELDARAGHYLWRVPDLSSADARLRLRFHRGGREIDGATSARFTLIAREREARGDPQALAGARDRRSDRALKPVADVESDDEPGPQPVADSDDDFATVHEGIWWTGMRALDVPLPAGALSREGDRITATRDLPAAGPLPAAPSAPRRMSAAGPRPATTTPSRASSQPPAPARLRPLRN